MHSSRISTLIIRIVFLLIALASAQTSYSDVYLQAPITWDSQNPPPVINDNYYIIRNDQQQPQTLTIDPGITVTFGNNGRLIMAGTALIADGTTNPITFSQQAGTSGGCIEILDQTCNNTGGNWGFVGMYPPNFNYCTFNGLGVDATTGAVNIEHTTGTGIGGYDLWINNSTCVNMPGSAVVFKRDPRETETVQAVRFSLINVVNCTFSGISTTEGLLSKNGIYFYGGDGTNPNINFFVENFQLDHTSFRYFGYNAVGPFTGSELGAAIKANCAGFVSVKWESENTGFPAINYCGNGIYFESSRVSGYGLSGSIVSSTFSNETIRFHNLRGYGIFVDCATFSTEVLGPSGINRLQIAGTGLDGIRVGHHFTDYGALLNNYEISLLGCTITDVGSKRFSTMTTEANGFNLTHGSFKKVWFRNCGINRAFSNGLKLYNESETSAGMAAIWTPVIFERDPVTFPPFPTEQGDPLNTGRSFPTYILNCGYQSFDPPVGTPLQDQTHGVRVGTKSFTANEPEINLEFVSLFDVGIGYCSGDGIAIRGNGHCYDPDRLREIGVEYIGKVIVTGCKIVGNENGINAKGYEHYLVVTTNPDENRPMVGWIESNRQAGILLKADATSPQIHRNKFLIGGTTGAGEVRYPLYVRYNPVGGFVATSGGTYQIDNNAFYVGAEIYVEGCRNLLNPPNAYGVCLNSAYADLNLLEIRPKIEDMQVFHGKQNEEVHFDMRGIPRIFNHTLDGVYVKGTNNDVNIGGALNSEDPALIYTNANNGVLIDQRPSSAPNHTSAGSHKLKMEYCEVYDNDWNGLWSVSRDVNVPLNESYGGTNIIISNCTFYNNTLVANINSKAGVWMDQYEGWLSDTLCNMLSANNGHGMLISGYNNAIQIFGGQFSENALNGFTLSASATDTDIRTFPAGSGSPNFPIGDGPTFTGPKFMLNGGHGFCLEAPSTQNDDPLLHLNNSVIAQNQLNGYHSNRCLLTGSNFRGTRFSSNAGTNFYDHSPCTSVPITYTEVYGGSVGFDLLRAPELFAHNVIHNVSNTAVFVAHDNGGGTSSFLNNTIVNEANFNGQGFSINSNASITVYANICQLSSPTATAYVFPYTAALNYNLGWSSNGSQAWSRFAPNHSTIQENVVGDPKLVLLPDIQYQTFTIPYRYHLDYRSPAINVVPIEVSECRDFNGTRGDLGVYGGGGFDPNFPDPTLYRLPIYRAGNVCLMMGDDVDDLSLSGTLKSGDYQFVGTDITVPIGQTLTVEAGTKVYMDYHPVNTPENGLTNITVNGRLETVPTAVANAPYAGLNGFIVFNGGKWSQSGVFEKKAWEGIVFSSSATGGVTPSTPTPMSRLKFEDMRNGVKIYGMQDGGYSDTLVFHNAIVSPGMNNRDDNNGDYGLDALHIKHRAVKFDTLRVDRFTETLVSNKRIGIHMIEVTPRTSLNPPFSDAFVSINRLIMEDDDGDEHRLPFHKAIFLESVFGNIDGYIGMLPEEWSFSSLKLTNSKIDGSVGTTTPPIESDPSVGIEIKTSYFELDRDTVTNIYGGNGLNLPIGGLALNTSSISRCRFTHAKHVSQHEDISNPDGVGIVFGGTAYAMLTDCDIDSNDWFGVRTLGTGVPYFFNALRSRGNRIFNNGLGEEIPAATGAQFFLEDGAVAPYIVNNSIFDQSTVPTPNRHLVRSNEEFTDFELLNEVYVAPFDQCLDYVWWGTATEAEIINRMRDIHTNGAGARFYHVDMVNEVRLPHILPLSPSDGHWGENPVIDGIQALNEGEYETARQIFFTSVTNTQLKTSVRSHAVPLLFATNERCGWTYEQNLALQDSFQTSYDSTDMFEAVRNYKPLLELLHSDPEAAYQTYQQFRIAPLSFQDSILAAIAIVFLEPIAGPENKRGDEVCRSWVAQDNKVNELRRLLYQHRRPTDTETRPIPESYQLGNPYPNPFNSSIQFRVDLPSTGSMMYTIYDALGREVFRKSMDKITAGSYLMQWNGLDNNGLPASSGVYFIQVRAGTFAAVKKVVMIK